MLKSQKFILGAVVGLVALASAPKALAWGDMGHKLVGGIAEEAMTEDARNLVRGILGIEPLSVAAIFPDQVRDDVRFGTKTDVNIPDSASHDFSPYHFTEIPVGQDFFSRPKKNVKDAYGVMKYTTDLLKNPTALRETKMIALRYLVHVVGDVHQPLHVGNGFDRGGNGCKIIWKRNEAAKEFNTNLHAFWDENLVLEVIADSFADPINKKYAPKYFGDFFKALKGRYPEMMTPESKEKYGSSDIVEWLNESMALREEIYPDVTPLPGKKGEEYKNRAYCVWYVDQDKDTTPAPGSEIDPTKIPVLSAAYAEKSRLIAEKQIFIAGLRLASILDKVAAEMKAESKTNLIDDKKQESILKAVHDALKNIF